MKDISFRELLSSCKNIRIPEIQRDYAQGRNNEKAREIRESFISSLVPIFSGIQDCAHLDFIYGYQKDDAFEPLDGQQRLTTLFIIHWMFCPKECDDLKSEDSQKSHAVSRFRYATRISSGDFCDALVEQSATELIELWRINKRNNQSFSSFVRDLDWFEWIWRYDPTVEAMLNTMDTILEVMDDNGISLNSVLYNNLDRIVFHKLDLSKNLFERFNLRNQDFKLGEDLYVKMNARGKELSKFDKLKSTLEDELLQQNEERFVKDDVVLQWRQNVDGTWMDYFWQTKSPNSTDVVAEVEDTYRRFLNRIIALRLDEMLEEEKCPADNRLSQRWRELKNLCQTIDDAQLERVVEKYVVILRLARFLEKNQQETIVFDRLNIHQIFQDVNLLFQKVGNEVHDITELACSKMRWTPEDSEGSMLRESLRRTGFSHERRLEYAALLSFINIKEVDVANIVNNDQTKNDFYEWMRFVRNCSLLRNLTQQIDKPQKEAKARKALRDMLNSFAEKKKQYTNHYSMRQFIANDLSVNTGIFEIASISEEKEKAKLRLFSEDWDVALDEAESNAYLWGQLRAPLNWSKDNSKTEGYNLSTFRHYISQLNRVFPVKNELKDLFWKALICIEDYRYNRRSLVTFDNDRDVSWKRYMREEQDTICAPVLKRLIDLWDLPQYISLDFSNFLDRFLFDNKDKVDDWRRYLFGIKNLSSFYCQAKGYLVDDNGTELTGHKWLVPKSQIGESRRSYELLITYLVHCPKPDDVSTVFYDSINPDTDKKSSVVLKREELSVRIKVAAEGMYLYTNGKEIEKLPDVEIIKRLKICGMIC